MKSYKSIQAIVPITNQEDYLGYPNIIQDDVLSNRVVMNSKYDYKLIDVINLIIKRIDNPIYIPSRHGGLQDKNLSKFFLKKVDWLRNRIKNWEKTSAYICVSSLEYKRSSYGDREDAAFSAAMFKMAKETIKRFDDAFQDDHRRMA